jgi:hypothetical protein
MECKLEYKEIKEIRKTREGQKVPVTIDWKNNRKYSNFSEAWKTFGKWIVAIDESKTNDNIEVSKAGTEVKHICLALRKIGFALYFYELIDDYSKEQYIAFNHMRLILDRVLVTNQVASRQLRFFLERYEKFRGDVFPKFFNDFPQDKIAEWSEQIDDEIEDCYDKKFQFKKIDRKKYWNDIVNPSNVNLKWDIKGCYRMLLSALNTLRPTLPKENLIILDDIMTRCEHGYYLGFLIEKTILEYHKEHPKYKKNRQTTRTPSYLLNRLSNFRKGRERRVILASKEAFEFKPKLKKKLNRMFEFEKV